MIFHVVLQLHAEGGLFLSRGMADISGDVVAVFMKSVVHGVPPSWVIPSISRYIIPRMARYVKKKKPAVVRTTAGFRKETSYNSHDSCRTAFS